MNLANHCTSEATLTKEVTTTLGVPLQTLKDLPIRAYINYYTLYNLRSIILAS
jgi:hypothetical protein